MRSSHADAHLSSSQQDTPARLSCSRRSFTGRHVGYELDHHTPQALPTTRPAIVFFSPPNCSQMNPILRTHQPSIPPTLLGKLTYYPMQSRRSADAVDRTGGINEANEVRRWRDMRGKGPRRIARERHISEVQRTQDNKLVGSRRRGALPHPCCAFCMSGSVTETSHIKLGHH
jgi:hypothetical protein